ncbi:peptide chain release factor prfb2 chloroplastic [Phtheirospermum japonicum]|uniref:Peptide chain release factor prfb2 chloroplastic n=1 Tax=Phtheirospermum japonicum TaxID=374723 RepID=A0A830BQ79_9LAMI|nr:peptide chain release factor prfb2 chloroplastic [Phtheirospermum japonicum]
MGFPRNYQLMSHRQPRPVWENQRMNYPMSTSSSSSMFASQTPANEIIFTGHPNDHAQMQAMDLVLDTNNINPNDQVMPNPTDNNGTGHCDVYAQPNNIMETDVDYSVLPFVSLDDDDDDHDLILDRYPNQHSVSTAVYPFPAKKNNAFSSNFHENWKIPYGLRFSSSQAAAAEATSTSDGLTVEKIIANNWVIFDENESDWKSHASSIAQSIHLIKKRLRWKKLIPKLEILSEQLNKPDLWDDPARAGKISREHGSIMGKMKEVNAFEQELFEHIDMIKLAREESDAELESESLKALLELRSHIKEKELEALLAGEHDSCSCFIEVQSGAGGTESMDWASMVMQMYRKWAEGRGFGVTIVDEMPGEIAGIKRATIKVDGEFAFGYAKAEVGAHRLVRISPFDSNKRRHTSFASVAVIPILGDAFSHVQINESDLKIERFRSGGAGGQSVNTTDSAVRITHIPTGVTATCQNERGCSVNLLGMGMGLIVEVNGFDNSGFWGRQNFYNDRSQHQNKASAMSVLQSRLDQLEMQRQAQINSEHTQSLTDINFGSQIRSYVLHPYRMVKDHRTDYEVSDPDFVLQGGLDGFILSFLSASLDKNEDEDI